MMQFIFINLVEQEAKPPTGFGGSATNERSSKVVTSEGGRASLCHLGAKLHRCLSPNLVTPSQVELSPATLRKKEKKMIDSSLNVLFYLFSALSLISGVMVITARNPVHSVLFLILVFCNAAGLLILLELDFFAMIFLVVYVGAIAVLFLFVVMMLNIKLSEVNENILRYLPIGGLIGILFLFEILIIVDNDFIPVLAFENSASGISALEVFVYKIRGILSASPAEYSQDLLNLIAPPIDSWNPLSEYVEWTTKIESVTNIESLGQILYTYYFYYFIVSSFILLIAMIGAIVLTMHKGVFVRRQEVYEQNTRDFTRTIQKLR